MVGEFRDIDDRLLGTVGLDGSGIAVLAQAGHPGDSTGWVQARYAAVATLADGLIERRLSHADC